VDTLNIIGNSNIHTGTQFVPITQKNLPSLILANLKIKRTKFPRAKIWLFVFEVPRIIPLNAMQKAQVSILNLYE